MINIWQELQHSRHANWTLTNEYPPFHNAKKVHVENCSTKSQMLTIADGGGGGGPGFQLT